MAKAAIIRLADYRQNVQAETNIREKLDADKLAKDSVEVEKKNLTATDILNKNLQELAKIIKDQGMVGKVTDKAQQTKFYGGAKGAIKERVESVKDFFTLRGFLDKTGIVQKGSTGLIGGIADKALERREAKQQYIKDAMKTDPTARLYGADKAKEIFGKRFDKSQTAGLDVQQNEKELSRLKEAGFTDQQIARSPEAKKKAALEAQLAKVDPRFRGADTIGGASLVEKASGLRGSNVVPLRSSAAEVEGSLSEEEIENLRMMEEQNDVLKQIEENTRPEGAKKEEKPKEEGSKGIFGMAFDMLKGWGKKLGGMLLRGLMSLGSMLGKGLLTAAKFLLNPAVLGKLITKVFPIAMIVGSLVNGLWDGIKTFMETGSLSEAIIAGLGGILEFLTFGLFDADTIKGMVESFTGFVDEYITKPLGNFFKNIKEAVAGFFENIGIPEISFSVFGKKIAFGPWYPFKKDDAPQAPESPTEGNQGPRVEGADQTKATSAAPAAAPTENKVSSEKQGLQEAAIQSQLSNAKKAEEQAMFETNPARKKALLEGAKKAREEVAVIRANTTQDETEKRYQEKLAKAPKNLRDDVGYQNNLRDRAEMEVRAERGNKVAKPPTNAAEQKVMSGQAMDSDPRAEAARNGRLGIVAQREQMLKDAAVRQQPATASQVYNKSAENQAAKEKKPTSAPVVVAPSTNVNNTNQTVATYYAPRNNESTFSDYIRRRAVG
jgi:hypothetical protein